MDDYIEAIMIIRQAEMRADATGKPFGIVKTNRGTLNCYPINATYMRYKRIIEIVHPKGKVK